MEPGRPRPESKRRGEGAPTSLTAQGTHVLNLTMMESHESGIRVIALILLAMIIVPWLFRKLFF